MCVCISLSNCACQSRKSFIVSFSFSTLKLNMRLSSNHLTPTFSAMAVLTDIPGLAVGAVSNGYSLREYDDEERETSPFYTSKYVESTSGESFALGLRFDDIFRFLHGNFCVSLFVDGQGVCERWLTPACIAESKDHVLEYAIKDSVSGFVHQTLHFEKLPMSMLR